MQHAMTGRENSVRLILRRLRIRRLNNVEQRGFSLVELLIGLALSMVVMGALTSVFVNSSAARRETERASMQIENGRYAMQLVTEDLSQAGYFAEFNPNILKGAYAPASIPDPCATALATLRLAIALPVQGYDQGSGMSACLTTLLSDIRSNTDVLVVRRVSTCVRGATDCEGTVAGTPYFQAAMCSSGTVGATELNSGATSDFFVLDTDGTKLTKHNSDCTTVASIRRFRTHIYFVANNDQSGDGIPTLKRAELDSSGFSILPLVEGIENLHFEYGIDTSAPSDGAPDSFVAAPSTLADWRSVVAARVYVLARNIDRSPGYTDTKTYTLGLKSDGTSNDITIVTADQAYKRHVYQAEVRLNNPAGRNSVP